MIISGVPYCATQPSPAGNHPKSAPTSVSGTISRGPPPTFGGGRILQFAATPNREERATTQPAVGPRKESSGSTFADALKWAGGEISQIQYEEDGEHTVAFAARNGTARMFQAPALRDLTIFTNSRLRGARKRRIVFGKQEIARAILRDQTQSPWK